MKRILSGLFVVALAALAVAAEAKLPKCSAVKCKQLGCPEDVLCASGTRVLTCADVCNGR